MINVGMTVAPSRRLIFDGPVIALELTVWKEFVRCKVRAN